MSEKRVHETMASADLNKGYGMVELEGTEKQITWAEDLRNRYYMDIMRMPGIDKAVEVYGNLPLQAVNEQPQAAWWIENKTEAYTKIVQRVKELAAQIKK